MAHTLKPTSQTLETLAQMQIVTTVTPTNGHLMTAWVGVEQVYDSYVQREIDDSHSNHWRDNDRGHAPVLV